MAYFDTTWYVNFGNGSSTGYYAVAQWANGTVYAAGNLVRQLATPTVGNERVFVCIAGGTSGGAEPAWTLTRGAKTTDNTVTWQEVTGTAAMNGDSSTADTVPWLSVKNQAVSLGVIIQDGAADTFFICSTAGTAGNGAEPTWNKTAGATTADNTVTWTSLGAISNFVAWGAPHARLANVAGTNWVAAGNQVFLGDNSAETQASEWFPNFPGTIANPLFIYCVDHTASVPPGPSNLKTTASVTTTGANDIRIVGSAYIYGITFSAGSGATNVQFWGQANSGFSQTWLEFDSCNLIKAGTTGIAIAIQFGNGGNISSKVVLNNTTVKFGSTSDGIYLTNVDFEWKNTSSAIQGATLPTTLFSSGQFGYGYRALLNGIDLSALGSGKTIFGAAAGLSAYNMVDCKLGASVTVASTPTVPSNIVDVVTSDSSGTTYQQQRYRYEGTLLPETTVVRTGGASDGITPISWKITTTANSKWVDPFSSFPIAQWNATTGANVSGFLRGIVNAAAVPNNDQIWMDLEYLGSASAPLGSFANNTKANNLATGTALAADTSAWDSQGPVRQNSTSYSIGSTFTVATAPGQRFWVVSGSGTTAANVPAGYASCVDGATVTDGGYTVRAGCRFQMSVTLSAPQPQLAGYLYATVKAALPSTTWWVDPLITSS